MDNEFVRCPLVDEMIEAIDCIENRDLKESSIPIKFKKKENWKTICEKCEYYNY